MKKIRPTFLFERLDMYHNTLGFFSQTDKLTTPTLYCPKLHPSEHKHEKPMLQRVNTY